MTLLAGQGSLCERLDLRRGAIDVLAIGAGEQRSHPAVGPCSDCGRAGLAGRDQILGELAVLLDTRTSRKRESVLRVGKHTKLLSKPARCPRVWAERSSSLIVTTRGWARPFPRTGCAPERCWNASRQRSQRNTN